MTDHLQNACFETRSPRTQPIRNKATSLIGRKLETIYTVPTDCCDAVELLLREIDRKLGR